MIAITQRLHKEYIIDRILIFPYVIFIMLVSLICFYEIKMMFIRINCRNIFLGLQKCERKYIAFYITSIMAISMILSYSYQYDGFDPLVPITSVNILLFLWIVIIQPYKSMLHNIGVIANTLPFLLFLGWNIARKYFMILQ